MLYVYIIVVALFHILFFSILGIPAIIALNVLFIGKIFNVDTLNLAIYTYIISALFQSFVFAYKAYFKRKRTS